MEFFMFYVPGFNGRPFPGSLALEARYTDIFKIGWRPEFFGSSGSRDCWNTTRQRGSNGIGRVLMLVK
jgi:hypothetical protein